MNYLEQKLLEIRQLTNCRYPSDAELVKFMQELVSVGYGDDTDAASIMDGLRLPETKENDSFNF